MEDTMISGNSGLLSSQRISNNIKLSLSSLYQSMERLSSGLRINRASDDPAGLVISEQLRAQIGSMNQEIENISVNINKYQTGDSLVGTMREHLTELRSLAVAAANTGFNSEDAQAAYNRASELIAGGYNRIIENSEYNGAKLFDGSEGSLANISKLSGMNLSDADSIEASLDKIDAAEKELNAAQVEIGSTVKNEFESERRSLRVSLENLSAAESVLRDTDYVSEYTNFIGKLLNTKQGLAMLAHSKVNAQTVLKLFG
jgi:flagellin